VDPAAGPAVAALVPSIGVMPDNRGVLNHVWVNGVDVTDRIRTADVDRAVPAVSRLPEVRAALLSRQRELSAAGGIVFAGRDIGTVVLPDADVKIWLDATAETRAARRARERGLDPASAEGQEILADLRRRDRIDGGRTISPARPAVDAIHVVTDDLDFAQTLGAAIAAVRGALAAAQEEEVR
jgi:cytidylate kinase